MHRYVLLLAFVTLTAQNLEGPRFEVASVRRIGATPPEIVPVTTTPTRVSMTTVPANLLPRAFGIARFLFVNLDKLPKDFYSINATLPEGSTTADIPAMLRNLLVERFHLTYHRERREVRVLELHVAETGPKLKEGAAPPASLDRSQPLRIRPGADGYVELVDGFNIGPVGFHGQWGMQRVGTTLPELANDLQLLLDGIVMDKTGLTGKYDFSLKWTDSLGAATQAPEFAVYPPLRDALREQLGLAIQESQGSFEVIVVDNLDAEPTPN